MEIEIHVAENGKSFVLDCQPTTTIETLQSYLPGLSGIPVHDQMLICGRDTKLEPSRTLQFYNLPAKNRPVFLFNRCRLLPDSPCPPPEEFEPIHVDLPPPPSLGGSHPLDEASNPVLIALPSYEKLFKYHYEKGQANINASQMKFDACRRLLREQEMQDKALETARGNMDYYYKIIDNAYSDFMKQYNRQYKQHSELLANLDKDLERLKSCRLHPGLRSQHHRTLLDCVKEGRVRKWAEDCSISFKQFNAKVADLREVYSELESNVQTLFYTKPAVNVKKLSETIEDHVRYTEEQASIIQSLSKDVNTVKRLVDDCVTSQYSGSLRPHDAVSALSPMYEVHDKSHLPRIEACDRELGKLLKYCQESKNAMSRCVHTRLQSVAVLQSNLKDMRNKLAVFKEAMIRQGEIFTELRIVRRMGSAYKACLAEVVRRKAWMKLFMGQAGQLAEKMARKREAEVTRRDEFLRDHSVYFSREVLEAMGLYENPSQCVVNIPPFDTNLLDIDIVDVEQYAPEALVGPLLKISGTDGRGRTIHSDSAFRTGSEGPSDARDDYGGEVDDGSDEIAGTSKLEVENAWLKAELASAVARLCHLDPEFEPEEAGDTDDVASNKDASHHMSPTIQKTTEALRLKDEYAKQLHGLLSMRQSQCKVYEKRIRELEQRLSDQHLQMQKYPSTHGGIHSLVRKDEGADSESSGLSALRGAGVPEPMDEGAGSLVAYQGDHLSHSNSGEGEVENESEQGGRAREALDETMSDVSGGVSTLEAAMDEGPRGAGGASTQDRSPGVVGLVNVHSSLDEAGSGGSDARNLAGPQPKMDGSGDVESSDTGVLLREKDEQMAALRNALLEKTLECGTVEERLKVALTEIGHARSELESNSELLSECQMNCAHLENRLHEAREEARINLYAADRRATEYNALRTSSVRLRGLTERLRSCISTSGSVGFAESLRSLAVSLSSPSDSGEDVEFRTAIRVLADKVGALSQQCEDLVERCQIAEANQNHLTKELENKTELLKNTYAKWKSDKQASKEMISFTRFQVHGLAIFLPDASGHYEALNRNCPYYFLSDESIALFLRNLPSAKQFIVGQIVHVDRNVARLNNSPGESELCGSNLSTFAGGSRSQHNPYALPLGTEYFVVTVAMVPDFSSVSTTV